MSNCSCGARGIDLDGHECVAWLRLELIKRNEQLAALGPWTVQTLRQYVADTSDGFECETGCDSYGHTELCPVTNTVQAFRLLRERLHTLTVAFDAEVVHGHNVAGTLNNTIIERDERILELEYQTKFNEGYVATLKELGLPERFLEEYQSQKMRIRELEGLLEAVSDYGELEGRMMDAEQQLKAALERLAEAEIVIRVAANVTPGTVLSKAVIDAAEAYVAKHSPEKERG